MLLVITFTFFDRWATLDAATSWFDIGIGAATVLFAVCCWAIQRRHPITGRRQVAAERRIMMTSMCVVSGERCDLARFRAAKRANESAKQPAAGAPIPTHDDLEHRRAPAQWLVCQLPNDCVPWRPLAATASAPLVRFGDPAGEHSPVRFDALTGDDKAELVETAEGAQVRAGEACRRGSVMHVEGFRMGGVRTSILGRPRRLARHRRAEASLGAGYTLNCEEPLYRPTAPRWAPKA